MPPQVPDILQNYRSEAELREAAAKAVELALSSSIAPLEGDIDTLESRRARSLADIAAIFNEVLPFAQQSAERVQQFYDVGLSHQRDITAIAREQLNQLREQRAAEAQALAQQIGGPVKLSEFLSPIEGIQSNYLGKAAGSLLKGVDLAEAEVGAAETFAGRVLPFFAAQSKERALAFFDRQIADIQKEITRLKAQKGPMINDEFQKLLITEREQALAKLQADRDFWAAKQGLKLEKKRVALEERRIDIGAAQFEQEIGLAERAQGHTEAYDWATFAAGQTEASKQLNQQYRSAARDMLANLTSPDQETLTYDMEIEVAPGEEYDYATADGRFIKLQSVTVVTTPEAIKDHDRAYQFLVSKGGIPKKLAKAVVRSWFGLPKSWEPAKAGTKPYKSAAGKVGGPGGGTPSLWSQKQLANIAAQSNGLDQLVSIAKSVGLQKALYNQGWNWPLETGLKIAREEGKEAKFSKWIQQAIYGMQQAKVAGKKYKISKPPFL